MTKKRFAAALSAVVLTLGMAGPAHAVAAGPVTDDYPYGSGWGSVDRWNYYIGECTSFVAWRLDSRLGVDFHNYYGGAHFGNANTWDEAARAVGLTVTSIPAPGAVAQSNAGTWGHVAWVSKVNANGTVTIEEYNHAARHTYSLRTVPASSFNYIYFGRVGNPVKSANGDRFGDVLTANSSGTLLAYPASSGGTLGSPHPIGGGWNTYSRIAQGDVSGDGWADIYGIDSAGTLWYYANNGHYEFSSRREVGHGWDTIIRITMADATGDGRADIIAIRDDGRLAIYPANRDGTLGSARVHGPGWSAMSKFGAGDGNGDGYADLYASSFSDGILLFYPGNASGFGSPKVVGSGWTIFNRIMVNDINGDGKADILATKPDGTLWRYYGHGDGTLGTATQIGTGWTVSSYKLAT